MKMTLRWFGLQDRVSLANIRQIPGISGIASGLYQVPAAELWELRELSRLREQIENAGLEFAVAESLTVPEEIKLGNPFRDKFIDAYCRSIEHLGEVGIEVLCYNFMPVFDAIRTDLSMRLPDGSTTLSYDHQQLPALHTAAGKTRLNEWTSAFGQTYTASETQALLSAYRKVDEEKLWENLAYFLQRIAPVAEQACVKLAIHPDDPPWPVCDLPRIITDLKSLLRVVELVESPANGITMCTGSLGVKEGNDLPLMIRTLGQCGRLHFVHCRNVRVTGAKQFHETSHLSQSGDLDIYEVVKALHEIHFDGPMRPDHGRMIWEEIGLPGYGLYDRALGASYLNGLWEAIGKGSLFRGE